ncbi:hypothetical protein F5883DRAFT_722426 [Diaporthe sp. PMI_573]|nr:hypothetical protein F5883DRAFT_722426 [Diaporthaceae sp. PMI_573]
MAPQTRLQAAMAGQQQAQQSAGPGPVRGAGEAVAAPAAGDEIARVPYAGDVGSSVDPLGLRSGATSPQNRHWADANEGRERERRSPYTKGSPGSVIVITAAEVKWPSFKMPKEHHLSGVNMYPSWASTWKSVLQSGGIPIGMPRQQLILDEQLDSTLNWKLRETMSAAVLMSIETTTSGLKIWHALRALYEPSGPANKIVLMNILDTHELGKDTTEYCTRFQQTNAELISRGIVYDSLTVALKFIKGTEKKQPEWALRQRQALRIYGANLSLEVLISDLVDEMAIQQPRKAAGTSHAQTSGQRPEGAPNVVCHYCGKRGHYERDCRKKKQDLDNGIEKPSLTGPNSNNSSTRRGPGRGRGRGGHQQGGSNAHASDQYQQFVAWQKAQAQQTVAAPPPPPGLGGSNAAVNATAGPAWADIVKTWDDYLAKQHQLGSDQSPERPEEGLQQLSELEPWGPERRPVDGEVAPTRGPKAPPATPVEASSADQSLETSDSPSNDQPSHPLVHAPHAEVRAMVVQSHSASSGVSPYAAQQRRRWLYDTGSDIHIINDQKWYTQSTPLDQQPPIMTGGGPVYATEVGAAKVTLENGTKNGHVVTLNYAVLIKDFPINIFSGERWHLYGGYMGRDRGRDALFSARNEVVTLFNVKTRGFYMQVHGHAPPERSTISQSEAVGRVFHTDLTPEQREKLMLWHRRLGHPGAERLRKTIRKTTGIDLDEATVETIPCSTCDEGTGLRYQSHEKPARETRPGAGIHLALDR